jgi:hypothetical protein
LRDPVPQLALRILDPTRRDGRFGLALPREKDLNEVAQVKRLIFDEWGRSNNTCLRIDGTAVLFGEARGSWIRRYRQLDPEPGTNRTIDGFESIWKHGELTVTQRVEIVPGRQSRCLDTCLVHYTLENTSENENAPPMRVGLRFLLDTYIGSTDGVPWTIPGQPALCDTRMSFDKPDAVPDWIEALEKDDPVRPGTVARLQFRMGPKLEAPSRVLLGGWPHPDLAQFGHKEALGNKTLWDVPDVSMRELHQRVQEALKEDRIKPEAAAKIKPDSAVTLYWDDRPLPPGARRELGFTYGLGQTAHDPVGKLLLSCGGRFVPSGEITVVALVSKPESGEKLTLTLPAGFEFLPGSRAEVPVPALPPTAPRGTAVVTWRMKCGAAGNHEVRVSSSTGAIVNQTMVVSGDG